MYYWALHKDEDLLYMTTMKAWKEPHSQVSWGKDAGDSAPPDPGL